jgi:hypothetical protein
VIAPLSVRSYLAAVRDTLESTGGEQERHAFPFAFYFFVVLLLFVFLVNCSFFKKLKKNQVTKKRKTQ